MRFVGAQKTSALFVNAEFFACVHAGAVVTDRHAAERGQILLHLGQAFTRRQMHGFDYGFHQFILHYLRMFLLLKKS